MLNIKSNEKKMIEAFIGKFSKDAKKGLEQIHGVNWEDDDTVLQCRECNVNFSVTVRKHHCR